MSDLRARVIRLAHERPDLRPHLLPLLNAQTKVAWSRLPDDAFDFGYEGVRASERGVLMANAVKDVVAQMKDQARVTWKSLAARLMDNKDIDSQPALSRRVVALALMDTYAELSKKSEAYFKSIP